jgi:hypothetical protein
MSAYNVLFVSEEKIKSYTSIHESVSPEDLTPYVLQAQQIYLYNYLGATFYNQLVTQITNSTISTPNRWLLDNYIGQILVNYAFYHALPFLKYKVFNKSVLSPIAENSPAIGLDELKFLQTQVREVAESYVDQMQVYLSNNLSQYPAYASSRSIDGQAPDKKTPYFSGLQTNSKFFNYRKYRNYPYGTGTRPDGWSGGTNNDGSTCYGCGDWSTN